jgi:RNA recognition motif-containing protein
MTNRLFVGGLPWAADEQDLRRTFEPFGNVTDAVIILDRETGRSRGFGFVTYETAAEAEAAIKNLDGADIGGRAIRVHEAQGRAAGGPPSPGPRPGAGSEVIVRGSSPPRPAAPPRSFDGPPRPPGGGYGGPPRPPGGGYGGPPRPPGGGYGGPPRPPGGFGGPPMPNFGAPEEEVFVERPRKADRKPKKAKQKEEARKEAAPREDAFANKDRRSKGGGRRGRSFDDFVDDDDF